MPLNKLSVFEASKLVSTKTLSLKHYYHRPGILLYTPPCSSVIGSPQMWVWPQLVFGRSPPHPPLQLEDPSLKPKPFPPRPLPPSSPHPPWLFLQCSGSPGRGGPVWCGGGVPRGVEGEGPPAVLWARPTSGGTRRELFRERVRGSNFAVRVLCACLTGLRQTG